MWPAACSLAVLAELSSNQESVRSDCQTEQSRRAGLQMKCERRGNSLVHCGCFFSELLALWVTSSSLGFCVLPPYPPPNCWQSISVHLCILSLSSSVSISFLCLISVEKSQWSPVLWCGVAALCPMSSEVLCCQPRAESTACLARVFPHLMQIRSSQRLWLILNRDRDSALRQSKQSCSGNDLAKHYPISSGTIVDYCTNQCSWLARKDLAVTNFA